MAIIAQRMKHNHTCWSINGGNNLAKILAKKCSGKLNEVAEKLKMPLFEESIVNKIEQDIIMSAKIKEKVGKGYVYPTKGSLLYLYESVEGKAHRIWEDIAGI